MGLPWPFLQKLAACLLVAWGRELEVMLQSLSAGGGGGGRGWKPASKV